MSDTLTDKEYAEIGRALLEVVRKGTERGACIVVVELWDHKRKMTIAEMHSLLHRSAEPNARSEVNSRQFTSARTIL